MSGLRVLVDEPGTVRVREEKEGGEVYASRDGEGEFAVLNRIEFNVPKVLGDGVIAPGGEMKVEVVCRGEGAGVRSIKWLFVYSSKVGFSLLVLMRLTDWKGETQDSNELLTTRTTQTLLVNPSIAINPFLQQSQRQASSHLLGLTVRPILLSYILDCD